MLLLTLPAFAANHYVNQGATGTGTGADWTNACTDFTGSCAIASLVRGDTYYVGTGTFTAKTWNTPDSGTTVITIKKAIVADHGTATGWNNAFAAQAVFTNRQDVETDYWTFDGQVGDYTSGGIGSYGFKDQFGQGDFAPCGGTNGNSTGAGFLLCGSNVTVRYWDCAGISNTGDFTYTGQAKCIEAYQGNNWTVSHLAMHGCESCLQGGQNNWVVEYSYIYNSRSIATAFHNNVFYLSGSNGGVFRYNQIWDYNAEGLFLTGESSPPTNIVAYGNTFASDGTQSNFPRGIELREAYNYTNFTAYNNTFYNLNDGAILDSSQITGNTCTNCVAENNLSVLTGSNFGPGWTLANNIDSSTNTSQFVSVTPLYGANFNLTANTATGTTLASPYNVDMNGNTRGVGSAWSIGAFQFEAAPTHTTWYVRPDGGGISDAGRLTGSPQSTSMGHYTPGCAVNSTTCLSAIEVGCDGKADVSYSAAVAAAGGPVISLHCALNDPRFLWDDQTFDDLPGMIVQGGDTVIIRGGPWRIGEDAQPGSCSGARCGAGYTWNYGNPTPNSLAIKWPSGISSAHTKIYGEHFGSCNTGPDWTNTTKSALTQIFGGWGLVTPIELSGSQYVDMACLEITRHSNCITFGSPALPSNCTSTSDYDSDGIHTDSTTANVTLTDMWIHGHTGRGIKGGIGGPVTAIRVNVDTNGEAGWDFDDGTTHLNGPAADWIFKYSIIQWSGCNQEYPFVDPFPVTSCYSVSTGGYGDGMGSPNGSGLAVHMDHATFRYNTQDALDGGHIDTGGPFPFVVTNSTFYSNNGGTIKLDGNASPVTVTGNYIVGDCLRMSYPITGAPSSFNANLADYCRSGDTFPFQTQPFSNNLIANNTIVTYFPTIFDYNCAVADCSTAVVNIEDNNILGFDNPAMYTLGGQAGGPNLLCGGSCNTHGNIDPPLTISHNNYYQLRNTPCASGNPGDTCLNPLMVSQPTGNAGTFANTQLDAFNINLTSSSPLRGAGTSYTGMPTLDYNGNPFLTPRVMGAVEFVGAAAYSFFFSPNTTSGGNVTSH